MLFQLSMIEPTWVSCLSFMGGDGFDVDILVEYLDRDDVRAAILEHPIPSDSDSLQLRKFLIEASSLSDATYQKYVRALPGSFMKFPEVLDPTKLRILIDEGKIIFTRESLDALRDNRDLQVLLVAASIDTYLADPNSFALDDGFRDELLRSEITHVAKQQIVELMDLGALVGLPERSALVGPIINIADANISNLDGNIAQSIIVHSRPIETQISLFNKCHSLMTDDEVRHVLASLPRPFSEIKAGYNTPRLNNSLENLDLVRWLDLRNIISSWTDGGFFTNQIRVNLRRR
jgi:hypothetical protein